MTYAQCGQTKVYPAGVGAMNHHDRGSQVTAKTAAQMFVGTAPGLGLQQRPHQIRPTGAARSGPTTQPAGSRQTRL
jgi:hypothetical protein